MTQEQIKEYTRRISQANASGLVEIIYELLLDALEQAKQAAQSGEQDAYCRQASKAKRYVEELIHGLNLEEPAARQVAKHYIAMHKQLLDVLHSPDVSSIEKVIEQVRYLQPHFIRIAKEDKTEPIMENTQKVYAGLTYGKNCLNEMSVDPSDNRGYQV